MPRPNAPSGLTLSRVARLWWPLAASWALMGAELPMLTAVVARMPDEEVHLAAYGSVVFPIALLVEAPIIMLLAASTALCVDAPSYRRVRRFMMTAGAVLTGIHVAVAFTPLYDVLVRDVLGVPEAVIEPGRTGLAIMTPWAWAIAYRRFQQGVLIRYEHSRAVGLGTIVRLLANASVLALGFAHGGFPGIVVGASAVSTGVVAEALYVSWRVRPVLRERLLPAPASKEPLTRSTFLRFYVPLAVTPFLTLAVQPIGAAAMSRMPDPLISLAAWPAVHGLVFVFRSMGLAYNEVVVRLVEEPESAAALRRFSRILAAATTGGLLSIALTPLADLWFRGVSALEPELAAVCAGALLLAVLMPGYAVAQSWFQGVLVQRRRTQAVTESVTVYLLVSATCLVVGVHWQPHPGIYVALVSFTCGGVSQTLWLALRSRSTMRDVGGARPRPVS